MMKQLKASLKGIVKGSFEITLNQSDKVVILSGYDFSNFDKQMINKAVKKVNASLVVFFR
jgi:hypothetical protein